MHSLEVSRVHNATWAYDRRLPPEILVRVFSETKRQTHSQSVVLLSHVCIRWRTTALGVSELWSSIYNAEARAVAEFVRRSRLLPLVVCYDYLDKKLQGYTAKKQAAIGSGLLFALRSLQRISELTIIWGDSTMREALVVLQQPAPLLKSIHVENVEELGLVPNPPLENANYPISVHTPLLQHLHCERVSLVPIPTGVAVATLRHLLKLVINNSPTYWSIAAFFKIVEHMHSMEHLELSFSLDFDIEQSPTGPVFDEPLCTLPSTLKFFILENHAVNLLAIITGCMIPAHTHVTVKSICHHNQDIESDVPELVFALHSWLLKRREEALSHYAHIVCRRGRHAVYLGDKGDEYHALQLEFYPARKTTFTEVDGFFKHLPAILSLFRLEELILDVRIEGLSGVVLRQLIDSARGVRHLTLVHEPAFLRHFNSNTPLVGIFSRLETLQLTRVDLDAQNLAQLAHALTGGRKLRALIFMLSAPTDIQIKTIFGSYVDNVIEIVDSEVESDDDDDDEDMDLDW